MSYHQSPKSSYPKLIYLVVILILFFLLYPSISGFFQVPRSFLIDIVSPLWSAQSKEDQNSFFSYFTSKQKLINENNELTEKVKDLEGLVAINKLLTDENERLKNILGRSDFQDDRILAVILVRPGRVPFDTLILDVGKDEGVTAGSQIIARDSNVIGEIVEVFDSTSRVILYSSGGHVTAVSVGENNISAEARGLGGGNYEVTLPREVSVDVGDIISVPGIEPFILGVVEHIEKEPADAFQRILFKSPVNIQEIKFVEVLVS